MFSRHLLKKYYAWDVTGFAIRGTLSHVLSGRCVVALCGGASDCSAGARESDDVIPQHCVDGAMQLAASSEQLFAHSWSALEERQFHKCHAFHGRKLGYSVTCWRLVISRNRLESLLTQIARWRFLQLFPVACEHSGMQQNWISWQDEHTKRRYFSYECMISKQEKATKNGRCNFFLMRLFLCVCLRSIIYNLFAMSH